jgi:hypothetical protein
LLFTGLLLVLTRLDIVVEIIVMSSRIAASRFRSESFGGSLEGPPRLFPYVTAVQYDHFVLRGVKFSSESVSKSMMQTLSSSLNSGFGSTLLPSPSYKLFTYPSDLSEKDAHIRDALRPPSKIAVPPLRCRWENQNSSNPFLNQQHFVFNSERNHSLTGPSVTTN